MSKAAGFVILFLFLLPRAAAGQGTADNLKRMADESGRAFITGDYERLVDLTYPKLVEILGGRAKMVAFLEKGAREMKADGAELISSTAGEPTQVTAIGRRTFAVVPITLKIKVAQGILVGESFLVGVSNDRGRSWTFVSGQSLDRQRMRILFPAAVGKLKFPPVKPPTLTAGPGQ